MYEPIGLTIEDAAKVAGLSPWWVKQELRLGGLKAVKAGRRTVITYESLKRRMARLPAATFTPLGQRGRTLKKA